MKRIISFLLSLAMLFSLFPAIVSASDYSPADFGWNTDGNNFTGWTVDETGSTYTVTYDGVNSKRIWKELLTDPQHFTLSFDVQVHNKRVEIELLGLKLELNTEGGNGNQIYIKDTDVWLDAAENKISVSFSRASGGVLNVTYTGSGNATPVSFTKTASDGGNKNVFLGVIDNGGSATFSNITLDGSSVQPDQPEQPDDPVLPPASDKSPADFGWETDNDNFTGWTVDEDGTTYTVTYDGVNSKRMWKELITDADNFTVSFDVIVLNQRIEIEIMGIKLELNASGGNGNQLYIKDKDSWMNATGQAASVTLTRENGGDLNVEYVGAGNSTPVTFTKKIADSSNLNVHLGVIDNGGSATFYNILPVIDTPVDPDVPVDPPVSDKTPADFGWSSDDDNFVGWTVDEEGTTFTVSYDGVNSKRIWKQLITNKDNFTISFDAQVLNNRAELEILWAKVELNCSGGNGNQIYIKELDRWIDAQNQKVNVTFSRTDGGDITVTYLGAGAASPVSFTITPVNEEDMNLYLGVIDTYGSATFSNITVTEPDVPVDPPVEEASPADFGWETDNDNYVGWTVNEEGTIYTVTYDGVNSKRIWKELITDADNFAIGLTVQVLAKRAEIEVMGVKLELNCEGGNGNQIYVKETDYWLDATAQTADILIYRQDGGDLSVVYTGKDNPTAVTFSITPTDPENRNLFIGVVDAHGSAAFSNIDPGAQIPEPEDPPLDQITPADFGWETDNDNYVGWTVNEEGSAYTVAYDGVNSKRIWKELITDAENFAIGLDVQILQSRAEIEVMGVKIELNCNGGNGSEIYIKELDSWISAADQAAHVLIYRQDGGDLNVVITGKGSVSAASFTPPVVDASNLNFFIGVIDNGGSAVFSNIDPNAEIVQPEDPPVVPAGTPADYGWETDNNNFTGWTMNEDGSVYTVTYDGVNSKRLWKELFADSENFTVSLEVQVLSRRAEIELMGLRFELNCDGGNGSQIYIKHTDSWLDCVDQTVRITIARRNGGDILVRYDGKGNDTPLCYNLAPVDASNLNFHMGVIDNGGSATFSNVTAEPESYVITWNVDGKITYEILHVGEMPAYSGSTDKASDELYHYTFVGWEPEITVVSADANYTAVYEQKEIGRIFTVTWNVDGTITKEEYEEGTIPSYKGSTDKADDDAYYYVFVGWDPEITAVAADITYTAVYNQIAKPSFTDVPENAWYHDLVYRSVKLGLFKGMSDNTFEPDSKLTRAMVIVILYRMDGSPEVAGNCVFGDVLPDSWYDDAVIWGAQNKIVNGISEDKFGPDDPVTREQLVTFLFRYANYKGYDTSSRESIAYFPDQGNVSSYALDAMRWAVSLGLITGSSESGKVYLKPYGNASRAEAAAIMVRFYDAFAE